MRKNDTKRESSKAIQASVKKEMAKPRMAMSARKWEMNLAAARVAPGKLRRNKLQSLVLRLPQGEC
jgi:hypothetical protein